MKKKFRFFLLKYLWGDIMADVVETSVGYDEDCDFVTVFTSKRSHITKMEKLAKEYPDDVTITNKNEDGSIVVHVPKKWMKLPSPPKKVSEEQRQAMAERMRSRKNS